MYLFPATIIEEPNQEDFATSSAASISVDKHNKVVTSAEVLPRKLSFNEKTIDEDDLTRIEQELFRLDKSNDPFNSSQQSQITRNSETETVINELFGEEFEKMDRDRLADRYDVLG